MKKRYKNRYCKPTYSTSIVIGNNPYKIKLRWLNILTKLGILTQLDFEERIDHYNLRNRNRQLEVLLRSFVSSELRRTIDGKEK